MSVAAVGIVVVVVVVVVVIVDMKMSVLCRRDHCLHAIKTMTIVIVMDRQQETGGWMDGWMDESIDCSKRWSISVSLVARCCPRCDRLLLLFVRFHVSLRLSVSPCPHTHTHFSLSRSISLHLAVSTCVFLCDGAPEKIAKPSTVRTSRDVLLEMRIWLWNYPGAIHGGLSRSSVVAATIGLSTLHVGEKNRVPIPTYLPTYLLVLPLPQTLISHKSPIAVRLHRHDPPVGLPPPLLPCAPIPSYHQPSRAAGVP